MPEDEWTEDTDTEDEDDDDDEDEEEEEDTKGSEDSNPPPALPPPIKPFNGVQVPCPRDCLIMCPVVTGSVNK